MRPDPVFAAATVALAQRVVSVALVVAFRIYRAGFAPALAAVIVLLFALTAPPDPLPSVVAPAEFDELAAARIGRQIVEAAPDRTPGSDGDAEIADMVQRRLVEAGGGR